MQFYFDKLREQVMQNANTLKADLAKINAPEFAEEYVGPFGPAMLNAAKIGWLEGAARTVANDQMVAWYFNQLEPLVAYAGRLEKVCHDLDIEKADLKILELIISDPLYRSEYTSLCEMIRDAVGDVRAQERERERSEAIDALVALGFAYDLGNDDYRRGDQIVTVVFRGKTDDYAWELDTHGVTSGEGISGTFHELLALVGIEQKAAVAK